MPDDDLTTLPPIDDGLVIRDIGMLAWAVERLGEAQAEIAENEALKVQAIARIEARVAKLNETVRAAAARLEDHVRAYMTMHRDELVRGKKKSRSFPSGTVGWRMKPARLVVVDEAALLAWAKSQPVEEDLVRVKYEVNKKALDVAFASTGEVPPGCNVQSEEETPYVKPEVPELALAKKEG